MQADSGFPVTLEDVYNQLILIDITFIHFQTIRTSAGKAYITNEKINIDIQSAVEYMMNKKNTKSPLHTILEDPEDQDKQHNDIIDSLNKLYRIFQEEYCQNPASGHVSVVSRSHLVCNGSKIKKVLSLPELYLLNNPDVRELRTFVTLLPQCAKFEIIHYPNYYDIFNIRWQK